MQRFKGKAGDDPPPKFTTEDVAELQEELRQSQALNDHLKEQLMASQLLAISMQGVLYKYKTYPVGLFAAPWSDRYFTLYGSVLKYFKGEKDVALCPRGQIEVTGSSIEWEGLKQGRYWTFGLKDSAGCYMIRLSSENRAVAEKWIEALEKAGAKSNAGLSRVFSAPAGEAVGQGRRNRSQTSSIGSFEELVDAGGGGSPFPQGLHRRFGGEEIAEQEGAGDAQKDDQSDDKKGQKKMYSPMVGSTPLHREAVPSILSSERLAQVPHPGIINLGAVVLFATNFRLILENMFKYGVLFNPFRWVQEIVWGSFQPLMWCWPVLGVCAFLSLRLETYASQKTEEDVKQRRALAKRSSSVRRSSSKRRLSFEKMPEITKSDGMKRVDRSVVAMHVLVSMVCLVVPLFLVYRSEGATTPCFVLTMVTLAVWMKLISYAHCNYDLRQARLVGETRPGERDSMTPVDGADQPLQYPENLTLTNLLYFLCAPTLSYQITFPRTGRIRKRWVMRRCLELLATLGLLIAIIDQYIVPAVLNTMPSMRDGHFGALIERVLKLSIPMLYSWLCMFYLLFHCWLNLLAELLRFGDREFYKDWWNATNLGEYWRMWNMPVHKWMLRTIYYPMRGGGFGRNWAMLTVFFVSAVFHEVAVAIPLKLLTFPWSFVGIMSQVPMVFLSTYIQKQWGDRPGNIFFWVSFCVVGQPICVLNYYYDWLRLQQ